MMNFMPCHRWMNFSIANTVWCMLTIFIWSVLTLATVCDGNTESSLCLHMYWWCVFVLPFRMLPHTRLPCFVYSKKRRDAQLMCVFIVGKQWCSYVTPASMYRRCEQRTNGGRERRSWKRETASEMERVCGGSQGREGKRLNPSSEDNANTYFVNRYF